MSQAPRQSLQCCAANTQKLSPIACRAGQALAERADNRRYAS